MFQRRRRLRGWWMLQCPLVTATRGQSLIARTQKLKTMKDELTLKCLDLCGYAHLHECLIYYALTPHICTQHKTVAYIKLWGIFKSILKEYKPSYLIDAQFLFPRDSRAMRAKLIRLYYTYMESCGMSKMSDPAPDLPFLLLSVQCIWHMYSHKWKQGYNSNFVTCIDTNLYQF